MDQTIEKSDEVNVDKSSNKLANKTTTDASSSKETSSSTRSTGKVGLKNRFRTALGNRRGHCQKPKVLGRNPYLNFLRDFRRCNGNLTSVEIVRRGAQEWRALEWNTKQKYVEEASRAPKVERCRQTPMMGRMTEGCGCAKRKRKRSKCGKKPKRRPKNKCGPLCGPKRRRSSKSRKRRC